MRKATFANLQRDLVKLEKAHKKAPLKPAALLDQTLAIVQKYPLAEHEDEVVEDIAGGLSTADLEPAIILSESFAFED